jgi:excisionase family DNA binding protein
MDDYVDLPNMPNYVSIKEAADILGLSVNRVYEYVTEGRLSGVRAADVIMIPLEEVRQFKRGTTGRPRKNNPKWRISPSTSMLSMTLISVQIQIDQQHAFVRKLDEIRQKGHHIFPGTIARYVADSKTSPGQAIIVLIWKDSVVEDTAIREEALKAFRQELADVLDWSTAQYNDSTVLIHT